MDPRPLTVLFVCTHNSCRSILAEALLNHQGRGRFRGLSAGRAPADRVQPEALELLGEEGIDTRALTPKSWRDVADREAPDLVFTVCEEAEEDMATADWAAADWRCGRVTANWRLDDPTAPSSAEERRRALRAAYADLKTRIGILTSLSPDQLDRLRRL
ncbi:MAG TPA: arsenate reductase ArsC [Azospirillaceae bacterium]|nr:arsenate reductase ArsC [Azospirillaceae bacterium]